MKLIDLLVQELPKCGGWPDDCRVLVQEHPGTVYRAGGGMPLWKLELAEDWELAEVTRGQYEAALAAAQQPVWDGEGLPPVGCECEAIYGRDVWFKVKIIAYDSGRVIGRWLEGDRDDDLLDYSHQEAFRPIRSEADKRRDEAIAALKELNPQLVGELAGYLYDEIAAGKIPHIRIEQAA
ncbi:hypothetical protein ACV6RK_000372 [Cronobacter malonaticus]